MKHSIEPMDVTGDNDPFGGEIQHAVCVRRVVVEVADKNAEVSFVYKLALDFRCLLDNT